jgi:hypothetical protein
VGKVIKVPDPTRPLIAPAPKPAKTIKIASESGTEKPYLGCFQDPRRRQWDLGFRFSRIRTLMRIGLPSKPNVSRSRRSRKRR